MKYVLLLFAFHGGTGHYHQLGKYASEQQCRAVEKPIYNGLLAEGNEGADLHLSCISEYDAEALRATLSDNRGGVIK
ncbi:MAG: hypothetical protein ACJ8FS_16485 [Sphingomicrobium sp.]